MKYFVSAGLLRPKKRDCRTHRLNRYLNYSLLGLASLTASREESVVLHGHFVHPSEFSKIIDESECDEIYLSLPSAYALEWAKQFIENLRKRQRRHIRVICGGRWVVDKREAWISERIRCDEVVAGLGESYILNRFNVTGKWIAEGRPQLNYLLMPDFREYQPSIEISRGCGMGCNFCVEAKNPRTSMTLPDSVVKEIIRLRGIYGENRLKPYFEASSFDPSPTWTSAFHAALKEANIEIEWRTTTRADSIGPEIIEKLAKCGLRVLDLGLESCSPYQLLSMGKTRDPATYLNSASDTIRACSDFGILVKLNILLFPGETLETISDTIEWLERHSKMISGISANPLIYYPDGCTSTLPDNWVRLGARLVDTNQVIHCGYGDLHLSDSIDNSKATEICLSISRQFMSARSYYNIKKYGYFSPDLSWDQFQKVAMLDDPRDLPFHIHTLVN